MKSRALSFGTFSSPLAKSQTQAFIDHIVQEIPRLNTQLTVLPPVQTDEDKENEVFTAISHAEFEHLAELLLNNQIQAVVMEAADLPIRHHEGLDLICTPPRHTPFDAYLNRQGNIMDEMDPGSKVGVMSMRSKAQLSHLWPDIDFQIMHGGIDRAMETHMRHSEIDGLVLPAAATEHLGIQGIVAEIYAPEFILPGPGQGSLVIVGRSKDEDTRKSLEALHCPATQVEIEAEMAFRSHMVSDQDMPIGVLARVEGSEIVIEGSTGACTNRVSVNGALNQTEEVGAGLAAQIMSSGSALADLLEAEFPDGLPPEDDETEMVEEDKEIEDQNKALDDEIAALDDDDDLMDPDEFRF